jgi:CRISPR-associated protein Csh1
LIKTIYNLGNKYVKEEKPDLIEAITLPIMKREDEVKYIVIVDFIIEEKRIKLTLREISNSTSLEYLFIGTADGAASPQWYGTVSNIEYLLSQTVTNLLERWDKDDEYYLALKQVQKTFFMDLGVTKKSEERYRYVFNPTYIGKSLIEDEAKKAIKEVGKQFQAYVEQELNVSIKDILLYSLAINGNLLISQPIYRDLVVQEKLSVFEEAKEGICALTNKESIVTGETTKFKFNYYINDKINFASDLEKKSYVKNLAIGKEAYTSILAGEAYILRHFNTRFSGLPCYIIPDFLYDYSYEDAPLEEMSQYIKRFVYKLKTLETAESLQREMRDYIIDEDKRNHISLNFLFYTKAQSALKINKLLSDVPLQHLHKLHEGMQEVTKIGKEFFQEERLKVSLDSIYYLIPMRVQRSDNFEKRKILQVYESLLTNKTMSYQWIIEQFTKLAKIHMYANYSLYQYANREKKEYNDFNLINAMLGAQLLLKLLRNLNIIEGGSCMSSVEYELRDLHMKEYMQVMNYNTSQGSLFLLGYLIARIGAKQVGRANERAEGLGQALTGRTANKPILSKLNYHGMNKQKLQMLSNDVFEKLGQLKISTLENEAIYAEHKRLFDLASQQKWSLSDRENIFYILSGYSYGTKRILAGAKAIKEE